MPVDGLVGLVRDGLPKGETIGIAVSGGGDSTALLHLALRAGFRVEAVTVDHALRAGSAAEAAAVAETCAALGVPHELRVWEHGAVPGNLMDAARRARMGLILGWAKTRGIGHVALGHTRDDQAETFLMGLARRAGVAGLSGMRRRWVEGGVTFHRPLLDASRAELRAWLGQEGVPWAEDPTNDDARYLRVRARAALAALEPLGISAEGLAEVAGHLARAQGALEQQVAEAAARHVRVAAGALRVSADLAEEPGEVRRQLVAAMVDWVAGGGYAPRAAELQRFEAAVLSGADATLQGVRARKGWVFREARALGGAVPVGSLWDGRWRVSGPEGEVRALGDAGLKQAESWRGRAIPREVLAVTPGIWAGETLLAAPLAGLDTGWSARLDAPGQLFGLSD